MSSVEVVVEIPTLSTREAQCLNFAAEGKSGAEIGRVLGLSEDTVKTHLRRLYRKLRVVNRAHAVHVGHQLGLLK